MVMRCYPDGDPIEIGAVLTPAVDMGKAWAALGLRLMERMTEGQPYSVVWTTNGNRMSVAADPIRFEAVEGS